jgi:hypothetical protein
MLAGGFRKDWCERQRLISIPQINHIFVGKQSFLRKSQIVGINHMFVGNKVSQGKVK